MIYRHSEAGFTVTIYPQCRNRKCDTEATFSWGEAVPRYYCFDHLPPAAKVIYYQIREQYEAMRERARQKLKERNDWLCEGMPNLRTGMRDEPTEGEIAAEFTTIIESSRT